MFGFGKPKESKAPPPPSAEYMKGFNGSPDAVCLHAMQSGGYNLKLDLVAGCVAAFEEGRFENLQAFFKGYLHYKIEDGNVVPDDGYTVLLVKTFADLTQDAETRKENARLMFDKVLPAHKQTTLNIILRTACANGPAHAVEAALDAGADANTGNNRPLLNAIRGDKAELMPLLYEAGADFNAAAAKASGADAVNLLRYKSQYDSETLAAYKQEAARMTMLIQSMGERIRELEIKIAPETASPADKTSTRLVL